MPRHFHKMMSPQFFNNGFRHDDSETSLFEAKIELKIENFFKRSFMIFLMPIKSLMSKIRSYF